ncbi:MAG: hypothetical protein EAZ84_12445 [Verrucomicrobia bacterium]|nr:MAG: hypothetical protein EAZ84_12445 [Verrucomicrobiota bacterium]TAE90427.1 MAG: hypothetical protein EAZ81_10145 [Verrucomicrobiota bacterium]
MNSSQSRAIRYAGPALHSEQKLHWKVRVWDQANQSTDWSAPATWTMGLLNGADWQGASWMGAADTSTSQGYAVESATADAVKWVQVDLGSDTALDSVLIRPQFHNDTSGSGWIPGYGFPLRFKVEISKVADFSTSTVIADHTTADFANPGGSTINIILSDSSGVRSPFVTTCPPGSPTTAGPRHSPSLSQAVAVGSSHLSTN